MKKEIADLWVKELRSGKWEQGTRYLCKDQKYCCLGVLCEIALREGVDILKKAKNVDDELYYVYGKDRAISILPGEVMNWAEIATFVGNYTGSYTDELSLTEQNDSGKTFEEIAEVIEKNYENL